MKCPFVVSAIAPKMEAMPPPSVMTQVVPTVPDETGETIESYHSPTRPADTQQLFQPIPQPQPVKPPSPPPKPVYSSEVSKSSNSFFLTVDVSPKWSFQSLLKP